jgi:nicotinate-nucleotide adenylyltransferase
METNIITEEMLSSLRDSLKSKMSGFRLAHTLGVEEMAARIGAIYCPEKLNILRAAALLHDITKELSPEAQRVIFERHGEVMSEDVKQSPATQHAITAALEIPERYPEFADGEVIGAVRYHTTGRAGMTLCEKIIYLSDYIDFTRTYSDCKALREMFWSAVPEKMGEGERMLHLDRVILTCLEMTVEDLIENSRHVSKETLEARDYILEKIGRIL